MVNGNSRSIQFYTEIVFVTVLSLVAANAWIRVLYVVEDRYFPNNLGMDILVSILLTLAAIFLLYIGFSYYKKTEQLSAYQNGKDKEPEVRHRADIYNMEEYQ